MTVSKKSMSRILAGLTVFSLISVCITGCKSPSSPEPDTITFSVTNDCGTAVHVLWNGVQQLSLEHGAQGVIPNPTIGTHIISANVQESGVQVVSATMEIQNFGQYYFNIEGPSTIRVTNTYGAILSITLNGSYIGDIGDNLTHTLRKIRFGEYVFEARVKGDETVVATASITVDGVGEFPWVIAR